MSIDAETLAAYVDGELDELAHRRVAQAITTDPVLAQQVERERALRTQLQGHFSGADDAPILDTWRAMIAAAADEELKVVSLDAAREALVRQRAMPYWGAGLAVAASLAIGIMIGGQSVQRGLVTMKGGALAPSPQLASALDTQLSGNASGNQLHIMLSFKSQSGQYCRAFAGGVVSGIACRDAGGWRLEHTLSTGIASANTAYRQAGSADAELMSIAQSMSVDAPLTSAQEAAALTQKWQGTR